MLSVPVERWGFAFLVAPLRFRENGKPALGYHPIDREAAAGGYGGAAGGSKGRCERFRDY